MFQNDGGKFLNITNRKLLYADVSSLLICRAGTASSLTNTVSCRKLFLNFLPLRNISPDFFCVYLFDRDKPVF